MIISAVAAMDQDLKIGYKNGLPWCLPDDLAFFKSITLNHVIVMGRKTFYALPHALPQRTNVILTRTETHIENALCFKDINHVLQEFKNEKEIMIIGGSEIFKATQHLWSKMYLTHIEARVTGDCHFPKWKESDWRITNEKQHPVDARHAYPFSFTTYEKV